MPDFVRVKSDRGHEFTTTDGLASELGLPVVEKPAVDSNGRPLPAKPNVSKRGRGKSKPAARDNTPGPEAASKEDEI